MSQKKIKNLGGRPEKPDDERLKPITIMLTLSQRLCVKAAARKAKQKVSAWGRETLLEAAR